jgi:sporulation protein YlmC with PRC-barrel domain
MPRKLVRLLAGCLLAGCLLAGAAGQSPPASVAAKTPAPPAPPAPAKVEQVRKARAESVLGQEVTNAKGDVIGHVVDILIDETGKPNAAVIEFTGFFGFGDRRIAVDWKALDFAVQGDHIAISTRLDADKLKSMPEYQQTATSVPVATPSHALPPKPH